MVRDALALRLDTNKKQIWNEVEAKTDNIPNIDLVWKPVNFIRSVNFETMAKRVADKPERPFFYTHYDNHHILTTKPGLIRSLKEYYAKTEIFKKANYTIWQSMALSFIVPAGDCLASQELAELKKVFKKIEKKDIACEVLPGRQLEKNFWILKPENENRGRGIDIITQYRELVSKLYQKNAGETFVI
mgnify:FL=1